MRLELAAELALLIDHAVNLKIGWPDIARCLGVSRQATRQHYQRRRALIPLDQHPVRARARAPLLDLITSDYPDLAAEFSIA